MDIDWTTVANTGLAIVGTLSGVFLTWFFQAKSRERERVQRNEDATRLRAIDELGKAVHAHWEFYQAQKLYIRGGDAHVREALGLGHNEAVRKLAEVKNQCLFLPAVVKDILERSGKMPYEWRHGLLKDIGSEAHFVNELWRQHEALEEVVNVSRSRLAPLPAEDSLVEELAEHKRKMESDRPA